VAIPTTFLGLFLGPSLLYCSLLSSPPRPALPLGLTSLLCPRLLIGQWKGIAYMQSLEVDPTTPIAGIEPVYFYILATVGSGASFSAPRRPFGSLPLPPSLPPRLSTRLPPRSLACPETWL